MLPPAVMALTLTIHWNRELVAVGRTARFTRMRCVDGPRLADRERTFRCTARYKGREVVFRVVSDGTVLEWRGPQTVRT